MSYALLQTAVRGSEAPPLLILILWLFEENWQSPRVYNKEDS